MHHIIKLWERVNVMTIADAIKKVLEKYPEGLTDKAIYEKMVTMNSEHKNPLKLSLLN